MADSDSNPFSFLSDLGSTIGDAIGGVGDALGGLMGGGQAQAAPAQAAPQADPSAQPQPQSQYAMPSYNDAQAATPSSFARLMAGVGPNPTAVAGNLTTMTNKALTEHESAMVQLLTTMQQSDPKASPQQLTLDALQTPQGQALFQKGGITPAMMTEFGKTIQNAPVFQPAGMYPVQTTGTGDATAVSGPGGAPVGAGGTGLPIADQMRLGTTEDVKDPSTPEGQAWFAAHGKTVDPTMGPQTVQTINIPNMGSRIIKMTPLSAIANPKQQMAQKAIDRSDKSTVDITAHTSSLLQLNRAGDVVTKLLDNGAPTGAANELARAGYGFKQQVGELLDMYGKIGQAPPSLEVTNPAYAGAFDRFNSALAVKGTNAARVDSALMNLGYLIARGNKADSNSRINESDVRNALDQIGDNEKLSNPQEMKAAIAQTIQMANASSDDDWRVKTDDSVWYPGQKKPSMPTDFLNRVGLHSFLPQASDTTGAGPNGSGPNFTTMDDATLKAFPSSPAAKTLTQAQINAYVAATKARAANPKVGK